MKTVKQILKDKGSDVVSIQPDGTVLEALTLMAERNVGALLVLEKGKPVGIFSERDYARRVALHGKSSLETPVKDLMTRRVMFVRPEQTAEECMVLMTEKHVRHLPVLVDNQLVGLVSIGDLVKASIEEKDFMIKQLENYITGGR